MSLFSYSLGENNLLLEQIFTFSHEINTPNTKLTTHYWIICLYSINICHNVFLVYGWFYFFWNALNSKAIKIVFIITIHIHSYPICPCWLYLSRFVIYIYIYVYICLILYFRQIISRINTIKLKFILIIFC